MVIFVYGEDSYRVEQKLTQLSAHFRGKFDAGGMNVDAFDATSVAVGAAREVIVAPPFLASKRFVIVRRFSAWASAGGDAADSGAGVKKTRKKKGVVEDSAPRLSPFAALVLGIPETTVAVFVDVISEKEFSDLGIVKREKDWFEYSFPALDARALATFATEEARRLGVTLAPAVANELVARVPLDSWYVATEIAKLSAAACGSGTSTPVITRELVVLHCEERADDKVFDLVDAIGGGSAAQALRLLENQLAFGSHPFQLLTMIERQVRMLLSARSAFLSGMRTPDALASGIGAHPFVARKLLALVSGAGAVGLNVRMTSLLTRIAELDSQMKTGQVEPVTGITLLLAK